MDEKPRYIIKLFWYTSAEYLEDNLRNGHIVLTEIAKSNDPFEYLPSTMDTLNKHTASVEDMEGAKTDTRELVSAREQRPPLIACLSTTMSSGAMWGHYANEHKGVCLVFEIPVYTSAREGCFPIVPVKYKRNRVYIGNFPDDDAEEQEEFRYSMLAMKGEDWNYEREFRILVTRSIQLCRDFEKEHIEFRGNKYFFDGLMGYLKGIILGIKCPLREEEVQFLLEKFSYNNVIVNSGEIHLTEFKVYADGFEDMHDAEYEFIRDLSPRLYFKPAKH